MKEVRIFKKMFVLHWYVAMCAHVVMNEEHDCGGGDQKCVVSPQ